MIEFTAEQVANNKHQELDPSMYDFIWNEDFTEVKAIPIRWGDDSSYADYQGME